uniref:AP-2 complex subunit alpha n=1 Tax=Emiliania huxleyi TaxID=2903 RepID=A0A0M4IZZ5_EMIHU|nr:adaptor protein complex 2 subunit alpha [Emiliania huxleyi]
MRGLTVFISDLRNCSSKEQEEKRVEKEMAHIRSKFTSDSNMNGYNRKKYVWKILYMYMLGYEVDFGHMEAVNLLSSQKYSEKSVGYAWCALMLREGDELLRLIINSIRVDLISRNDNAVCLALNSICNVGGKEFAETLSNDVLKLLTHNITKTYVRKKAALTALRLFRKSNDTLPAEQWADRILALLDEKNIGVLTSVTSLVLGVLAVDSAGWEAAAPKAARTLTRLVLNKDYSNDYLYYGIPTPWLQIKLLKVLQHFPPPEEHALKLRVSEVLQRIVSGTEVTKNVNKNNATHAVLFEAINLSIHLGQSSETLPQCINLLGRFISIREANIRYLGLDTMARLSQEQPHTLDDLKKHQSTILFSLKDPDISIRRRALDLVYAMCDTATVKETVSELLNYLDNADDHIKEELVLKIAILSERFASDNSWYVDVVLQLVRSAGDQVADEVWYRIVQIVTNQGEDLQRYAAQGVWTILNAEVLPHKNLVKVAGYVLGEFGHTIAESPGSSPSEQITLLHKHFRNADPDVRALLLNTYVKIAHTYAEVAQMVSEVMQQHSAAMDQEVQQRAAEYISLSAPSLASIKGTVLEMMPHFTERESIVSKALASKSKGDDPEAPTRRVEPRAEAAHAEAAAPPPPPSRQETPDLLGGLADEPAAPAPPPGGGGGAGSGGAAAGGGPSPQWLALCMRNDGVLFEDATLQIGVKMEFNGHQGRMALFFGNKGQFPLQQLATVLSPCPQLAIQVSPLPSTLQPRQQLSQNFLIECNAPFGDGPQVKVSFMGGSGPAQIVARLPLNPSKFFAPLVTDGGDFFRRWKLFEGKELQKIFKLKTAPLAEPEVERVCAGGMKMAVLRGVDPNTANYVVAGWMAVKGGAPQSDTASVLMRLEVNAAAGMCRASVRASDAGLATAVAQIVQSHLAAP